MGLSQRVDLDLDVAQPRDAGTPAPCYKGACTALHYGLKPGEVDLARTTDQHGIRCALGLYMASKGLTVRGLSEATGVHTGAISKLRSNHFSMVDALNVERICRYLEIEVGDLLYLEPPLNQEETPE